MSLSSFRFCLFFLAVFAGLWLIRLLVGKSTHFVVLRKLWLLLASYSFLVLADSRFALCLAALTLVTWVCALAIPGERGGLWLRVGVLLAVAQLGVFKYTDFFVSSCASLLGRSAPTMRLIVPLGVSFYTFSAISYLMDVHRGRLAPMHDLSALALYMAFFPKLSSGPLIRADRFFDQLNGGQPASKADLLLGVQLIARGFFRKLVLADHLGVFVDSVYAAPSAYAGATVFLATLGYSLQIYFDFAGYSDLAIGFARLLGFSFDKNFNLPYLSANPTEFWKRWHISLSLWLQEYLYYPLGGNRRGQKRTYLNLFLTMLIGGLWHGADWSFLLWGALHGLALIVHKQFLKNRRETGRETNRLFRIVSPVLTFLFVNFCWVFFRADNIGHALQIFRCIFRRGPGLSQPESWVFLAASVMLGEIASALLLARRTGGKVTERDDLFDFSRLWPTALFFVLVGVTIMMAYTGNTVFIYGNF